MSSAVDGVVTSSGQNGKSTYGGDAGVVSSPVDDIRSSSSTELRSSPDTDQHNATDGPVTVESKTPGHDNDNNTGGPDDEKSSEEEGEPATTTEREAAQSEKTNNDDKPSTAEHNGVTSSVDEEQVDTTQPRDPDGVGEEVSQTKDIGDGESATETKEAEVSKADQRNRKRYALGRKLQGS